jgi:hypothetical protein
MDRCLICREKAKYGDLCADCWLGLKCFDRNPKLLGRATAYVKRKGRLRTKHHRRESRKRESELSRLINEQRKDANDRETRFDYASRK